VRWGSTQPLKNEYQYTPGGKDGWWVRALARRPATEAVISPGLSLSLPLWIW
jgi:hypothetical protein